MSWWALTSPSPAHIHPETQAHETKKCTQENIDNNWLLAVWYSHKLHENIGVWLKNNNEKDIEYTQYSERRQ
jgi:hypothetical protein